MSTLSKKIVISIIISLIFLIVNLPAVYKITNDIGTSNLGIVNLSNNTFFDGTSNCPTMYGQLLHTVVFAVLVFLQMNLKELITKDKKSLGIKAKHTLYASLMYFVISSPALYKLMGELSNGLIADGNGCPSLTGVLIHTIVFAISLTGIMYLPDRNE